MKVLARDLEGTLISNAVSQIARPGLFEFLEDCRKLFPRVVMFTSVNEDRFRSIASLYPEDDVGLSEVLRRLRLKLATSPNHCLTPEKNEGA